MPYAPILAARTDYEPVPRVEVTFSSVAPAAERATVYRSIGGRTYRVRGGVNVYAAGGFSLVDYEAPFTGTITYRAQLFDADGVEIGYTDPASVALNVQGSCIHQPLDPERAVQVRTLQGTAAELGRPFSGELVRPQGRSVPVWIGSGRSGLDGVSLQFYTDTAAQEASLQSIFGGYDGDEQIPIVCVRSSLPLGLPQPFFANVRRPSRIGVDTHLGGEAVRWDLSGDEAAPPVEGLVLTTLTYGDIEATFTTYSELEAAYLTYLPLESDYSLAGTV